MNRIRVDWHARPTMELSYMVCAVWIISGLIVAGGMNAEIWAAESRSDAVIQESFDSLRAWTPLTFPKIARHSQYTLQAEGQNLVLQAKADASASALVHTTRFAIAQFPMIRWRLLLVDSRRGRLRSPSWRIPIPPAKPAWPGWMI